MDDESFHGGLGKPNKISSGFHCATGIKLFLLTFKTEYK